MIDGLRCSKDQLESALRDVATDLSKARTEISHLQSELDVARTEFRSNEDLNVSFTEKVCSLEAENLELKHLLAS